MPFEPLLGNEQLKTNLARSLARGHISHFYLISGPEGSGKHTLARLLSAAILCQDPQKPCLRCPACRKVLADTHPDCITMDDPEKKTVSVDLVRQARADIYIQPNESDHKIYLFPRAQDMRLASQNALLKVLEEPPRYGVFLLLADNPNKLLPTVRSRCTELKMLPLSQDQVLSRLRSDYPKAQESELAAAFSRSGGFLGQAIQAVEASQSFLPQSQSLVQALCTGDALLLMQTLVPMEKWKRDALDEALSQWLEIAEGALACRSGMDVVSPLSRQLSAGCGSQQLITLIAHLKKAAAYTQANVSPGAVCGYLAWKLQR